VSPAWGRLFPVPTLIIFPFGEVPFMAYLRPCFFGRLPRAGFAVFFFLTVLVKIFWPFGVETPQNSVLVFRLFRLSCFSRLDRPVFCYRFHAVDGLPTLWSFFRGASSCFLSSSPLVWFFFFFSFFLVDSPFPLSPATVDDPVLFLPGFLLPWPFRVPCQFYPPPLCCV